MARATAKTKRIYEAGRAVYGDSCPASADLMLKAIAMMISESQKKPKAAPKKEAATLPFGSGEMYEAIKEQAGHIVGCVPYDTRWFSRLGRELQSVNGLVAADLDIFISWVLGGGLDFFPDVTFAHVIKNFSIWLVKARAINNTVQQGQGPEGYMND